ncbi:peptidylglycine alpha-hydroxylating monooxygenase-like [Convolutriloba macropyga]|uniref:peptidylglycine alpha-hydroxylating monooxygenase-like n=1 Tax=Convolutriloba macropyga TaxID=536237 RepID=UPI003F52770C
MRNIDSRASIKYKIFPTQDDYELYKRDESIFYEPDQESKCYLDVIVKVLVLLLVIVPVLFLAGTHFYPKLLSHEKSISVAISLFRPYVNDQYVCVSYHLDPNESYYVTKFETSDKNAAAHHMLLYACEKPAFEHDKIWSCGHMAEEKAVRKGAKKLPKGSVCGGGDSEIIFAEAMQAGSYSMPKGVSFKLGHDSKFKYLTLQIHYANVDKFTKNRNLFDNSGLKLNLAQKPTNYTAHVMLLATGGGWIPKNSNITNLDILCTILAPNEKISMKPFAFRNCFLFYPRVSKLSVFDIFTPY